MQQERSVIYRAGAAAGLGHMVVCWAGYIALARYLNAPFVATSSDTYFSDASILENFDLHDENCKVDFCAKRADDLVDDAVSAGRTIAVIGRKDLALRSVPAFLKADNIVFLIPTTMRVVLFQRYWRNMI